MNNKENARFNIYMSILKTSLRLNVFNYLSDFFVLKTSFQTAKGKNIIQLISFAFSKQLVGNVECLLTLESTLWLLPRCQDTSWPTLPSQTCAASFEEGFYKARLKYYHWARSKELLGIQTLTVWSLESFLCFWILWIYLCTWEFWRRSPTALVHLPCFRFVFS